MEDIDRLILELNSGDDQRAEVAVRQLHLLGERATGALEKLMESEDADVRWWATWAIAGITSPVSTKLLRQRLSDPEESVRQCAALGLRQQPDEEAIPDLVTCLLSSQDRITLHLAAAALAVIGCQAVDPLLDVLKQSPLPVRLEILRALSVIGDTRAVPALFEALESDSVLMEHWANDGLERLGIGMSFFKT
jgi:HEAT repeat protein